MDAMKKDFQKLVKHYRDQKPDVMGYNWRTGKRDLPCRPELPKAMMTEQQIRNRTATINFGREGLTEAQRFTSYEPFTAWCQAFGIEHTAVEINPDGKFQIRVTW